MAHKGIRLLSRGIDLPVTNNNEVKYNLVFARQIKDDADLDIVKEKLKIFFNNKQNVVEKLFLKEKIILKKDLSKDQALKYKLVFETTGAECSIYKVKSTNKNKTPGNTQKTVQSDKEQDKNNTITHEVDNSIKATGSLVKDPDFSKKIIWTLVILIVLSIASWGSLHFINSDYTISVIDENKQELNKSDSVPTINYLLF